MAFENAVETAGIEDFRFHDCRHHFASWYMMRGGSPKALQILGHASMAMTTRYAHLSPEHLRSEMLKSEHPSAVSKLDDFSPKSGQSGKIASASSVSA